MNATPSLRVAGRSPGHSGHMSPRRPDVLFENGYEAAAWRQIQEWERRPDVRLTKAVRTAARPVSFLTDKLLLQPVLDRGGDRIGEGMRSAASSLGARVDRGAVLRRVSAAAGRTVDDLPDIGRVDLRTLDGLTKGLDRKYIAAASASGGTAGAASTLPGGSVIALGALGADVVATSALLLRAIAGYGTHYGRDVSTPQEAQFAVGILSLGAVAGHASVRTQLLGELNAVGVMIAAGATWAELSTQSSVKALQAVFDKLGMRLTKRKLAQVIPFFGAAAGGALGAVLADNTCQAAYMQYRRRYLLDKYPALREA
jgi:hypothetical protein